ncbi:hypothetical protein M3P05_04485 [Sansalvadorimonas sp. 2012CJ34-2]|uniref:Uncharacterized protein n=1 Tax=Parendozoicomonas callyspongiae TaxID=2942213 RepID=A0ABT0PDT6_9GAMM|nr:hypothetical protein [Sansalvadorimonas sp. 2012CJ34-2]MCL6269201.1 hypothetical protein [Sansalvadorimonas sp. 2012CJ34-2]
MSTCIHRHAIIAHIPDERIVANMDVECVIIPETPASAVDVKVDIIQRGGKRLSKHFVLPADISYNLPHYLRGILQEAHLESKDLTSPLVTDKGSTSPMVMELLDELVSKLRSNQTSVDISRYLSFHT